VVRHRRKLEAVRALPDEQREWYDTMRASLKTLKQERSAYKQRVRKAKGVLEAAKRPAKLSSVAGATLYDTEIKVNGRSIEYSSDLRASVDATGNIAVKSRTTATRVVAGTVVAGPVGALVGAVAQKNKVVDAKELYLLLEDSTWAEVVKCPSEQGQQVRAFAQQVNLAAPAVDGARERRRSAVAAARSALVQAESQTEALDKAHAAAALSHGRRPASAELDRLLPLDKCVRALEPR
jgi:hypothetical protein